MTTSESQPQRRSLWPIGLFVIGCLIANTATVLAIDSGIDFVEEWEPWAPITMLSLIAGQAYFIMLVAGLVGATWATGLLTAWALLVALTLAFCAGFGRWFGGFFSWDSDSFGQWPVVGVFPGAIFLASLPLLLCRFWAGWRLTRAELAHTSRERIRLGNFFQLTTLLASFGLMWRVAGTLSADYREEMVWLPPFLCAFASGLCLFVLVPSLLLDRWLTGSRRQWLWLPLFAFLFAVGAVLVSRLTQQMNWWDAFQLGYFFLCQVITAVLGWICLRASGFRIVGYAPKTSEKAVSSVGSNFNVDMATNPFEDHIDPTTSGKPLRTSWGIPIAFALLAMLLMGFESYWTMHWKQLTEKYAAIEQIVQATGGEAILSGNRHVPNKIDSVMLGAKANDSHLQSIADGRSISRLYLDKTQITDKGIEAISHWDQLNEISLNDTAVSDQGLQLLVRNSRLGHLSIANTRVTAEGLKCLPQYFPGVTFLDVSGLGLTGTDLQFLSHHALTWIKLCDNALTDESLRAVHWSQANVLREIDLSGNPIHGSGLAGIRADSFILTRMPLRDEELAPILADMIPDTSQAMGQSTTIELAETSLTDGFLKTLASANQLNALTLGDGNFTDQGLADAQPSNFSYLTLNGKQFTGECFKHWQPAFASLDMSSSGLTDANVSLVSTLQTNILSLSNTAITDAALPALVKSPASSISLQNTKITFQGLMSHPFTNATYVSVSSTFTQEEKNALKSLGNVYWTEE